MNATAAPGIACQSRHDSLISTDNKLVDPDGGFSKGVSFVRIFPVRHQRGEWPVQNMDLHPGLNGASAHFRPAAQNLAFIHYFVAAPLSPFSVERAEHGYIIRRKHTGIFAEPTRRLLNLRSLSRYPVLCTMAFGRL